MMPARPGVGQAFTYSFIRNQIVGLEFGDAEWGDVDNDGDLDLLVAGLHSGESTGAISRVYVNIGEVGSVDAKGDSVWFHQYEQRGRGLVPTLYSSVAWTDLDNDGRLDLAISGARRSEPPYEPVTNWFRSEERRFLQISSDLVGVMAGSLDFGDYDNDGDQDLFVTGQDERGEYTTRLYRNEGFGIFQESQHEFVTIGVGDAEWGDYDNDGDLDILISGDTGEGFFTGIYRNESGQSFTKLDLGFSGVVFSAVDWGDYDNDGDLDALVSGGKLSPVILQGETSVYRNEGNGEFTLQELGLVGSFYGEALFGDYNNDGWLDIFLSGANSPFGERIGRMYVNNGVESFSHALNLSGLLASSAAMGDYDGDFDLDVFQMGQKITNQFRNDHLRVNDPPLRPAGLSSSVDGNAVTLSWERSIDGQTPSQSLTYNIRVGTQPGGIDIVSPLSILNTGRRLVAEVGNVNANRRWTLQNLEPGTYYWSVQALDHSFAGSPFADEETFVIEATGAVATTIMDYEQPVSAFRIVSSYPNPFLDAAHIRYDVSEPSRVDAEVYNTLGERVAAITGSMTNPGQNEIIWNGRSSDGAELGPGAYLVRIQNGRWSETVTVVKGG
jgi:hypothetical protein